MWAFFKVPGRIIPEGSGGTVSDDIQTIRTLDLYAVNTKEDWVKHYKAILKKHASVVDNPLCQIYAVRV